MSQLNNDAETKSTSKEPSYLDKNKVNNDNSSADEDENCLESQSPKATKKRGRNKTYEILKKFDSNVDLNSATDEMNQIGWVKRLLCNQVKHIPKQLLRLQEVAILLQPNLFWLLLNIKNISCAQFEMSVFVRKRTFMMKILIRP
jgi:hypothetical protein